MLKKLFLFVLFTCVGILLQVYPSLAFVSLSSSVIKIYSTVPRTLFSTSKKFRYHTSLRMASSVRTLIEKNIADNKVMIFSKSYCPFCDRAKEAIKNEGYDYTAIELDVSSWILFYHSIV